MTGLLIIFAATYVLIASEKVDKAIAAVLGGVAVIALHYITFDSAMHHIDLNVIFLLVGMMMVVNILATTGLFEWIAATTARSAKGNGLLILILLMTVTAVFSTVLANVTTVILVAPITILVCEILEVPAVPFLILQAVASNVGGTATLVGDPPNMIIGSKANISFNQFLINMGPIILITMIATFAVVAVVLRKKVRVRPGAKAKIMLTEPALAITHPRRMIAALAVFALVLVGFVLGGMLHIKPGIVALGGGFLMALVCRMDLAKILERAEWNTVMFFVGLFVLVGALTDNGVFTWLGNEMMVVTHGHLLLTAIVILWVSALVSAVVDNIPLAIAMVPLIKTVTPQFAVAMGLPAHSPLIRTEIALPLFYSLVLGACLGGNGTLVGASPNVVISQIARKNKYNLSFWGFTAWGFPLMIMSLVLSSVYIYLRFFVW